MVYKINCLKLSSFGIKTQTYKLWMRIGARGTGKPERELLNTLTVHPMRYVHPCW